jgi:hypothetical protein
MICIVPFLFAKNATVAAEEGLDQINATIEASDCRKCHEEIVFTLSHKGEGHKEVCLGCHRGHPPADMEIIPSCSRCHGETEHKHFSLENCLQCHVNPHTPLEIELTRDMSTPCLTCHTDQYDQLQNNPSIHTRLACTACHTYHGLIQPCQNCHVPHSDSMAKDSCNECHMAHQPLVVAYGQNIVSEDCGSCHSEVYGIMANNKTKHRQVTCVSCHYEKHGMIPACTKCHGQWPHPTEILNKFTDCNECHGIAHDLMATDYITNIFKKN